MIIHDDIPEHDVIATRARRALYQLAGTHPMNRSWAEVRRSARRVQQKRLSVVGAAGALVLIGASAAVANASARGGRPVNVIGSESTVPTTNETTTTITVPFWYGSSSAPPRTDKEPVSGGGPPVSGSIPDESETTQPAPVQPQDGSWSAAMSVDATEVAVDAYVTVHAELTNTGTQPQYTNGYGSLAITCARWLPTVEAAPGWPVGQFVDNVIMAPGETRTFSMTFRADAQQVGEASCTFGLSFQGDASWASAFPGLTTDSVAIEIVAPSTPSTDATTTTETTVPERP